MYRKKPSFPPEDENRIRAGSVSDLVWSFPGQPIMIKNLQFRTAANRAATARSGNDLANFKRFFNGACPGSKNYRRLRRIENFFPHLQRFVCFRHY